MPKYAWKKSLTTSHASRGGKLVVDGVTGRLVADDDPVARFAEGLLDSIGGLADIPERNRAVDDLARALEPSTTYDRWEALLRGG